jgi:hypothetical protein
MTRPHANLRRTIAGVTLLGLALCAAAKPQNDAADAVLEWNAVATDAMIAYAVARPPGVPPYREARIYAMAFVAIHDSLNAIQRRYQPYVCDAHAPGASPAAAVAAAAHEVLVYAFPAQASLFDAAYDAAMAEQKDNVRTAAGVALGRQCAHAILAVRANDGAATAQVAYVPGNEPGDYRFTPPFDQPGTPSYGFVGDPLWGSVAPFALASSSQFRSPPPYALESPQYAADVNEVKTRGAMQGSNRTAAESEIALFWRESSPLGWNRIARTVALAHGIDGWDMARLFALLQIAEADAYLASLETKYHYNFWRPVTAIRLADTDGNDATSADPAWMPFHPVTPPIPDYNSAHSTAGGAAQAVLSSVFGRDDIAFTQTSTSLPGVTRGFATFTQAADENGLSRILVGYHFRLAVDAGRMQGEQVGRWVVDHVLLPGK